MVSIRGGRRRQDPHRRAGPAAKGQGVPVDGLHLPLKLVSAREEYKAHDFIVTV
jgi:hypothetical protein